MNQNVKIANELIKLAKSLMSTVYQDKIDPELTEEVDKMNIEQIMKIFVDYVDKLKTADDYRIKLKEKAERRILASKSLSVLNQRALNLSLPTMADNITNMDKDGGWYNSFDSFQRTADKLRPVLIRLNQTLQRFQFITQNTSLLDEEVKEYVEQAIKYLKHNHDTEIDKALFVEFKKALWERKLTVERVESKQPADKSIPEYIKVKRQAGQLSAKLSKALTIASQWTNASMMFVASMGELPEEQEVKVFVSNSSALMKEAQEITNELKQKIEQNQSVRTAGFLNNLKEKLVGMFNKIVDGFNYIKSKIQSFLNKNNVYDLEILTDKLEETINS